MNKQEFESHFEDLVARMRQTLVKKGNDYSNEDRLSNFKEVATILKTHPAMVCLVLIGVKISRINNLLATGATPENEALQDSSLDLANYAVLLDMILNEK